MFHVEHAPVEEAAAVLGRARKSAHANRARSRPRRSGASRSATGTVVPSTRASSVPSRARKAEPDARSVAALDAPEDAVAVGAASNQHVLRARRGTSAHAKADTRPRAASSCRRRWRRRRRSSPASRSSSRLCETREGSRAGAALSRTRKQPGRCRAASGQRRSGMITCRVSSLSGFADQAARLAVAQAQHARRRRVSAPSASSR